MEKEDKNKGVRIHAEASTKPQNKTSKSLKARSKIAKKSTANDLKTQKGKVNRPFQHGIRNRKNKNVLEGEKGGSNIEQDDSKKLNSGEEKQTEDVTNKEDTKNSECSSKNQEDIGASGKSQQKQRSEDKSTRNQKNKEKHNGIENSQEKDQNKEKLGGLIFMCSRETKPDCFRYRVMGVSTNKKDLVLSIKPGLKLFLYDFDLKLMYGIYKASSSGAMKLEPKAFGGAFPAQVRFSVHIDCLPLPESTFKKAIKENYNDRRKFKAELTPRQVRKLTELFRPASVQLSAQHVLKPAVPKSRDREVYAGERESKREILGRDNYANSNARSYPRLSREKDERLAYGEVGSLRREEAPRDLYMSEKEYRAYGLHGERKNQTTAAPLDPYQRDHERRHQHLPRHSDPVYRDAVPGPRDSVPADRYLNEREYQTYSLGGRHELRSVVSPATAAVSSLDAYTREPYNPSYYYGASAVDSYMPPSRRDEVALGSYSLGGRRDAYLVGTEPLRRGETEQVDRLYSSYAGTALSNYNQGAKPEAVTAPVSSRYAFAGPSLTYR